MSQEIVVQPQPRAWLEVTVSPIIQTCHLIHVELFAYLKDALERMVSGQTKSTIYCLVAGSQLTEMRHI